MHRNCESRDDKKNAVAMSECKLQFSAKGTACDFFHLKPSSSSLGEYSKRLQYAHTKCAIITSEAANKLMCNRLVLTKESCGKHKSYAANDDVHAGIFP